MAEIAHISKMENVELRILCLIAAISDFFGTKEMISSSKMKNELLLNNILLFPYWQM